jgi:hypothetical protein
MVKVLYKFMSKSLYAGAGVTLVENSIPRRVPSPVQVFPQAKTNPGSPLRGLL